MMKYIIEHCSMNSLDELFRKDVMDQDIMEVLNDSDKEDEVSTSRNINVNSELDKVAQNILDVFEDSDDDEKSYISEDLEQDEITRAILDVFEDSDDSNEEVLDHCGQDDKLHAIDISSMLAHKRKEHGFFTKRSIFSYDQRLELEEVYEKNPYPSHYRYTELAGELGIEAKQVRKWFQHRRRQHGISNKQIRFSMDQKSEMEEEYEINPYPTHDRYTELAGKLGVEVKQVKQWFKNRRTGRIKRIINSTKSEIEKIY